MCSQHADALEIDIFYDEDRVAATWAIGGMAFFEGVRRRMKEGTGMTLRRAGLGLLVGAILMAPSVPSAAPALVFEPYNGTALYAEDPMPHGSRHRSPN